MMNIRIIHRQDGVYDVYERATGKWIMSRNSADNVFSWLNCKPHVTIDFVDEMYGGVNREAD